MSNEERELLAEFTARLLVVQRQAQEVVDSIELLVRDTIDNLNADSVE